MSSYYGQLRQAEKAAESNPQTIVTQQTWLESIFLIRGRDGKVSAWHYILVPQDKRADLKAQKKGSDINTLDYGRYIQYRDGRDRIQTLSGWGTDPPKKFQQWIGKNYDVAAIDNNTELSYIADNIRLCIMQRSTAEQLIGILRNYHNQHRFHYITFDDDYESSLAYRSGMRNYDRIIELNGVNVENDTYEQFRKRFITQKHLPVEMLVCSPSTYEHYRSNNKRIHRYLPTVQHLKPVYDTSLNKENTQTASSEMDIQDNYYVVQWMDEKKTIVSIVPQCSIFKSPAFIHVNDICVVEHEGSYQKGRILLKDAKDNCEIYQRNHSEEGVFMKFMNTSLNPIYAEIPDAKDQNTVHQPSVSCSKQGIASTETNAMESAPTRLEDLPNDVFFDLFKYMSVQSIYRGFWNLNIRFNHLLQSIGNVSLNFDDEIDPSSVPLLANQVLYLSIDTSKPCDLSQFPYLQSLIIRNRQTTHLSQIQPNNFPNLVRLYFALESDFQLPKQLVDDVFSGRFPHLRKADLGRVSKPLDDSWLISFSLRSLSIRCDDPGIVPYILMSCPELLHLHLHCLFDYQTVAVTLPQWPHPLKRWTLWSYLNKLSLRVLDSLLVYTPNVERMYIQTKVKEPVTFLMRNITNRLPNLVRFECFVKEDKSNASSIDDLDTIHKMNQCYHRIQCKEETDNHRIFDTDYTGD